MTPAHLPRKLLPFLAAVLLSIVGFNLSFSELNPSIVSPIQQHLEYLEECEARGERIDAIIIGSSLVISGIDTPLLESLMREDGYEGFSALTVAARSYDLHGNNRILREVLKRDVPGLKLVILDQTFFPYFYPRPEVAGTPPYIWLYADPMSALGAIDGVLRSGAPAREKFRRVGLVLDHFRAGVLAFNFVGAFTKPTQETVQEADTSDPYSVSDIGTTRGHRHHTSPHPSLTPERWKKYFARMSKAKREAGAFEKPYSPRVLRYPFEMARRHEVGLVLLFMPSVQVTNHADLYRELVQEYEQQGVKAEVWDVNDLSVPENLTYMQYELRGDTIHLAAGSEPLTHDLAARVRAFLESGGSTRNPL